MVDFLVTFGSNAAAQIAEIRALQAAAVQAQTAINATAAPGAGGGLGGSPAARASSSAFQREFLAGLNAQQLAVARINPELVKYGSALKKL